jgi:hypothetical protein
MNTLLEDWFPFVSVIMPVRNEAKYIQRSLGAVLAQDYPADRMEVIIADGMSDDGTRTIIETLSLQRSSSSGETATVKVIDNPERIVSTGLNRALALARGDIIVRVDGHCEIERDYVRMCVEHILVHNVDGVGGPIETLAETSIARAIAVAISSPFGVGNSTFRIGTDILREADTVPFPAYRREAIERAGAYDVEQARNQDDEYNYRLRKLGCKLLLVPQIRSKYYSRASLGSLWRQYFQYGYWKVRVMHKHPRQTKLRQFVPVAFVLSLLLSVLMLAAGHWLPVALVTGAYVLANITASIGLACKKDFRLLPVLPLAFASLHVGYGSGFLWGLFRFWNRWKTPGKVPELKMSQHEVRVSTEVM